MKFIVSINVGCLEWSDAEIILRLIKGTTSRPRKVEFNGHYIEWYPDREVNITCEMLKELSDTFIVTFDNGYMKITGKY